MGDMDCACKGEAKANAANNATANPANADFEPIIDSRSTSGPKKTAGRCWNSGPDPRGLLVNLKSDIDYQSIL